MQYGPGAREAYKSAGSGAQAAAWDDGEKDRKLRTRIRWLNNEGGFQNKILYDKVAEASEGLDVAQVMDVLRSLETNWEKVWEPTAWVVASLRKAASSEPLDPDFDRRLRGRVRWLNNEGGFHNAITYAKVAQASAGVPAEKVFTALRYLEEKGPGAVEDPTAWVCAGIAKAHRSAPAPAAAEVEGWGEWDEAKDRKLRTRIRWLNHEGGFQNQLVYDRIAEVAEGVATQQVMEVLQNLEANWDKVWEPTAWVCSSLRKLASAGPLDADFDWKLRARVRWLNHEGGFGNVIMYSKIAQAAAGVPPEKVLTALKYLEEKGPGGVEDPTSWVCAGIIKAYRNSGSAGQAWDEAYRGVAPAGQSHEETKDQRLRKHIRWLNGDGGFENKLKYDKIAQAADGVGVERVIGVLQKLEANWETVGDPTAWVVSALTKPAARGAPSAGGPGLPEHDFDRQLRARVRSLNTEGGFANTISYSKIAQASAGVPPEDVFTALRRLEDEGPAGAGDPTAWVCAAISQAHEPAEGKVARR